MVRGNHQRDSRVAACNPAVNDEARRLRAAGSVLRGVPDVDGSHETGLVQGSAVAAGRPLNGGIPLKLDLCPSAGAPPGQDDALEQGGARGILPAADQRGKRTVPVPVPVPAPVHDLIQGLESGDMPVHARLSPKNLRDERADRTVIGEALEETKGWDRGIRRVGAPHFVKVMSTGLLLWLLSDWSPARAGAIWSTSAIAQEKTATWW